MSELYTVFPFERAGISGQVIAIKKIDSQNDIGAVECKPVVKFTIDRIHKAHN